MRHALSDCVDATVRSSSSVKTRLHLFGRLAVLSTLAGAVFAAPRILPAAPVRASADSTATATLDGVVTDSLQQPVAGVEIFSADGKFKATTNSVGAFRLAGIPSGAVTFVVRKIGYGAGEFTLTMDPGATLHQTIVLTRLNNVLKPVVVEETAIHRGLRDVGFYDRSGGNARGTFLSPEFLAARGGTRSSDLLRNVNGVRIQYRGGQSGGLPFGTGGYMKIGTQAVCLMNLYIDGDRVELGGASDIFGGSRMPGDQVTTMEDVISPNDIGAIEVYPSGVTSPQKYTGVSRGCGTILIWTKVKLNAPQTSTNNR
jgi:hypothetical protein